MQISKNKADDNKLIKLDCYYDKSEVVIFDIETTGFAAASTKLYLIGCGYYEGNDIYIIQWFNDDG